MAALYVTGLLVSACSSDDPADPTPEGTDTASSDVSDVSMLDDTGSDVSVDISGDSGVDDTSDTGLEPDGETEMPPPDLSERLDPGQVRAGIVTDPTALLGGVRAEGRVGDIKLYNALAAFIVEAPGRAHGGYRYFGGSLIDADVVRPEGVNVGGDRFNEVIHSWNLAIFEPESVEIVADGADGVALVRLHGKGGPFYFADSFLRPLLFPTDVPLEITYEYELRPDEPVLRHRVILTNPSPASAVIEWPITLSNQGDGFGGWKRGKGFDFSDGDTEALYLVGHHTAHAVMPQDGVLSVLLDYSDVLAALEPAIELPGNGSVTREYLRWVGGGGSAEIEAAVAVYRGAAFETLSGTVAVPDSAPWDSVWVSASRDGEPMAVVPVDAIGAFSAELPPGEYTLTAWAADHAHSEPVTATAGGAPASLTLPQSGFLTVTVVDSNGDPVHGRATIVATGDTPSPWAPGNVRLGLKGGWGWNSPGNGGKISAVGYAVGGEATVTVPAGTYEVRVSRGFSWTIAAGDTTVTAGETAAIELVIDRVVDTTGWMSGDFHVHAMRSPDSDTPYDIRARQSVTEELDLAILTEHVQIGGLQPALDAMEVTDSLGVYGQEVTTFEYGHFNAFPLVEDATAPNYGAVLPYDKKPKALFAAIRDQHPGEEVIQINHPRGSSLGSYFDAAQLDSKTGEANELWDTNWDAIEVFNGNCKHGQELEDWILLTNLGMAKTLAGGSDSHRENDPIGMPRSWVKVGRAAVEGDREAIVEPVRQRQVFVSCGPFVRFTTTDAAVDIGGRTGVDENGMVSFHVQVQAPGWMTLDELRFYRNGDVIDVIPIETPGDGVRLDTELSDIPSADAWYAVEVAGSGNLLPVHRAGPPNAFTNPIEVDVDGDGVWTPPGL